ncbi:MULTISPECIES: substrate-binding domain-containing protein [unclassified Paraburkholderia]|uniref:substrate-binding domain-containing protein n=1 Tax=unclassified Paraburkholderia TaxID=2615204 RepID=UPI0016177A04|nr:MULTISPECIES: substrate-binding domain-containing protein [unclassified Paraburkholderia]MBB5447396.1 ribose transport system substrate-binding protein [Paraburkholderia sp. WSM4177]MBB5484077.1 ribose transport system substrate-binding protein [Paraburkholderia sp. WSM4180]
MRGFLLALACACVLPAAAAQDLLPGPAPGAPVAATDFLALARRVVDAASRPATPWNGPRKGPPAQSGKHIAVVAEDLRNGGILGVVDGVLEAAKVIGWRVRIFDSAGAADLRLKMLADALASRPDGLILAGGDARALLPALRPFAENSIPIVGWHVAAPAGPVPGTPVAMNVSTDPREVARVTALAAILQAGGHAGVVIFTDTDFQIARDKAQAMAAVVRACSGCTLLEVRDVAISRSRELVPGTTRALLARYGPRWTCALAINDIYFDYAAPVLTQAGMPNAAMIMLSAGDGSESAFLRIRTGTFQTGTVAEPLNLHGWQLVDEMNRLFAGVGVTGYVTPVHLVTADNVAADGGDRLLYDPDNGYRDIYRQIWQRP